MKKCNLLDMLMMDHPSFIFVNVQDSVEEWEIRIPVLFENMRIIEDISDMKPYMVESNNRIDVGFQFTGKYDKDKFEMWLRTNEYIFSSEGVPLKKIFTDEEYRLRYAIAENVIVNGNKNYHLLKM
jgi:hypothetical protein